eukprot:gene10247-biopygen6271
MQRRRRRPGTPPKAAEFPDAAKQGVPRIRRYTPPAVPLHDGLPRQRSQSYQHICRRAVWRGPNPRGRAPANAYPDIGKIVIQIP